MKFLKGLFTLEFAAYCSSVELSSCTVLWPRLYSVHTGSGDVGTDGRASMTQFSAHVNAADVTACHVTTLRTI